VSNLLSTPTFFGGRAPSNGPLPRSSGRRSGAARALAIALIVIGALVLTDAAITLVWQEPISALYAKLRQDHLSGALKTIERAPPSAPVQRALASLPQESSRIEFLARKFQQSTHEGSPVGRIRIPSIGATYVVVKGTGTSELESGPGVYPETNFPGIGGTTAIAGHRTTYLAPFRHIDSLRPGNRILLAMPYAHFTYTVIGQRVVSPTDVRAAVANVGFNRLVLSACTPLFSAEKRLLVMARLTSTVPVGAASRPAASAVAPAAKAAPMQEPLAETVPAASLPAMLKSG